MRIAVLAFSRRKIGGIESYIESLLPALIEQGHELSFWAEQDHPKSSALISIPPEVPEWCAEMLGMEQAFNALRTWKPDILYAQGFGDPGSDVKMHEQGIPIVQYIHNYYGTCISGRKAFAQPRYQPCTKVFSPLCLVHYFPRRCGGLNPVTMWKYYKQHSQRLALLPHCSRIVVASKQMAAELARHSLPSEVLPPWPPSPTLAAPKEVVLGEEIQLLFVGRMEPIKGGQILLEALPLVETLLGKRLLCHFIGSGSARKEWEQQAALVMKQTSQVRVIFHGWLEQAAREKIVVKSHLLVIPSVWPEPFGLVGLEAGTLGVPSVAFDVGGITEWLTDGGNGVLAPANSLTALGLSTTIANALLDPIRYARLRDGAIKTANEQFTQADHLARLNVLLEAARIV